MHSVTDWFTPSVATIIATFVGLIGIWIQIWNARHPFTLDRYHAKRLAIFEFTQKRLQLWDQVLKLELDAAEDSAEQKQAKQKATLAIERALSDGSALLRHVDYKAQLVRSARNKPHNLQAQKLKGWKRIEYWIVKWVGYSFVVLFACLGVLLIWYIIGAGKHQVLTKALPLYLGFWAISLVSLLCGISLINTARTLKYPEPDPPTLGEL